MSKLPRISFGRTILPNGSGFTDNANLMLDMKMVKEKFLSILQFYLQITMK